MGPLRIQAANTRVEALRAAFKVALQAVGAPAPEAPIRVAVQIRSAVLKRAVVVEGALAAEGAEQLEALLLVASEELAALPRVVLRPVVAAVNMLEGPAPFRAEEWVVRVARAARAAAAVQAAVAVLVARAAAAVQAELVVAEERALPVVPVARAALAGVAALEEVVGLAAQAARRAAYSSVSIGRAPNKRASSCIMLGQLFP